MKASWSMESPDCFSRVPFSTVRSLWEFRLLLKKLLFDVFLLE